MKAHELLGLILVREGILSSAQLDAALAEQRRMRAAGQVQPLGVVVLQLVLASEGQVRHALRLQKKLAWAPEQAPPLGVRLVQGGVVSPSLLVSIMDEEARTGEGLEQLLLDRQLVLPAVMAYFKSVVS